MDIGEKELRVQRERKDVTDERKRGSETESERQSAKKEGRGREEE